MHTPLGNDDQRDAPTTTNATTTRTSSGKHKMVASDSSMHRRRASGSLRDASGGDTSVMSLRPASRSRTCKPVVPADPSMNTFKQ